MDGSFTDEGSGILSNALELATWNRERTSVELRRFIEGRHAALPADIEIE